jgi:hypothetical protein
MPVLDISLSGSSRLFGYVELMAVMAYPSNKEMRGRFKATYAAKNIAKPPELKSHDGLSPEEFEKWKAEVLEVTSRDLTRIYMLSGGVGAICDSPDYQTMMTQHYDSYKEGFIAGKLLTYIMAMYNSEVTGGASVNKAVFIAEHYTKCSQSYIRRAWSKFKSVSHFWAALNLWESDGQPEEWSPFSEIRSFLYMAEWFRVFGTTYFPRAQTNPILLPDETWLSPREMQFSEHDIAGFAEASSKISSLPQECFKILEQYRAPKDTNPLP